MKRRDFFATAGLATVALSCNPTDNKNNSKVQEAATPKNQALLTPFNVPEGEGRSFWGPGGDKYEFLVTGKQSGNTTFILHCDVPAGGGPPPHIHNNESESYYVDEGDLVFTLGDQTIHAKAGDLVHIPKGTVHTFTNKGTQNAKMLTVFAPSGMEGWFEEVLVPVKDKAEKAVVYTKQQLDFMIEAGPRHGVTWRLPPETGKGG
jgi:quercetin dioxygenase-like cupin family protein